MKCLRPLVSRLMSHVTPCLKSHVSSQKLNPSSKGKNMLSKSKVKHLVILALAVPLVLAAKPVIDDAHDRVQTTLDPMMDRIGTLVPRSAREIGPSRLALGCEMLPRE